MQQYLKALRYVMRKGVDRPDRTGVGSRAVFGLQMRFDLTSGFPAMTTKKLALESVKAELLWFLSGSSRVQDLQKLGCHIWDANAQSSYWKPKARFPGDLGRVYGVQWRKWRSPYQKNPIDQISRVIKILKENPHDRRLVVTAWNPAELEMMALPPCHMIFQFFSVQGKLSLHMYQRSCDMFLGVPFNIASYSLFLHMVARIVNLKPWEFVHTLGDAHIYLNHFKQVREQLKRKPYKLPRLWLNPKIRDIDDFKMEDIKLVNYKYHPVISAPMAV